jgi:hypothetical protein
MREELMGSTMKGEYNDHQLRPTVLANSVNGGAVFFAIPTRLDYILL